MSAEDAWTSDCVPGLTHPRETYDLLGHHDAEADLAAALSFGRLHHAWLLTGPKGVGKATLAYRAARIFLGAKRQPGHRPLAVSPDDPLVRQIAAETHPDLRVLRRVFDEKTGKLKSDISVEDARTLSMFFNKSAANGGRRIAVVDTADALNRNAANALLKTIEEPPPGAVIFIICHSPGSIPRTIVSRCRRLTLRAPAEGDVLEWLSAKGYRGADALLAVKLAQCAPGRAIGFAKNSGAKLYSAFVETMLSLGGAKGASAAQTLIDMSSAKNPDTDHSPLDLLFVFALDWLSRVARAYKGVKIIEMLPGEVEQMLRFTDACNVSALSSVYSDLVDLRNAHAALNLDRGHTAVEIFVILSRLNIKSKVHGH